MNMGEENLEQIRQKKLAELQQRQQMQQMQQEQAEMHRQQAEFQTQKQMLINQILDSNARARLTNIRLTRPQFAENIEIQLIQALQSGALRGKIPLTDEVFKGILMQVQNSQKRESKIKFM